MVARGCHQNAHQVEIAESPATSDNHIMNIEHVALNVPDPVAMARWYVAHLGMRVLRQLAEAPFTHFLADAAGRAVLELYGNTKVDMPNYAAWDPLTLHVAFHSEDIAKDRQRLLQAGASAAAGITVTPAGDEMTFLRDPWGVGLQLIKRARPLSG